MERYVINGGRRLSGSIELEGAKNAVLPMLAAACLTNEEVVIKNCPRITDVMNMLKILSSIGVKVAFESGSVIINASDVNSWLVQGDLSKKLRSSVFMMGALLSRFKVVEISSPGGCDIGERPIDIHLSAFKELGAVCECFSADLSYACGNNDLCEVGVSK